MVKWKRIRDFILFTFSINLALVGLYLLLNHLFGLSEITPYSMAILGMLYMLVPMIVSFILIKAKYKEKQKQYSLPRLCTACSMH